MAEAGGDPRQAKVNILIIGLGSGVGAALLAHHYPEASIVALDIDQVVIDMVRDYYPLLAWLEGAHLPPEQREAQRPRTSDGRPRLSL